MDTGDGVEKSGKMSFGINVCVGIGISIVFLPFLAFYDARRGRRTLFALGSKAPFLYDIVIIIILCV